MTSEDDSFSDLNIATGSLYAFRFLRTCCIASEKTPEKSIKDLAADFHRELGINSTFFDFSLTAIILSMAHFVFTTVKEKHLKKIKEKNKNLSEWINLAPLSFSDNVDNNLKLHEFIRLMRNAFAHKKYKVKKSRNRTLITFTFETKEKSLDRSVSMNQFRLESLVHYLSMEIKGGEEVDRLRKRKEENERLRNIYQLNKETD